MCSKCFSRLALFLTDAGAGADDLPARFIVHDGLGYLGRGAAKAELVDAHGDAVRGFELDSSVPFAGDSPRVVMSWHTAADAERSFPAQVQVRWGLTRTLLYGFTLSLDCASSTTPLRTDDAAATSPNRLVAPSNRISGESVVLAVFMVVLQFILADC